MPVRWPFRRREEPAASEVLLGARLSPYQQASSARAPWFPPVIPPEEEQPADAAPAGVQLGFADGSVVHVAADSPQGRALRAMADVLLTKD